MLENLQIRHKLLVMLLAPILGILVYSVSEVKDGYIALQDLQATQTLTGLDVQVGALCHEIQKERGYSSGYLNARGAKFRDELSRQRERVDAALVKVREYVSANGKALAAVKGALDGAEGSLGRLKENREGISALTLSGGDSYGFYTGLIESYLEVTAAVATTAGNRDVMREATAYYALVKSKEEAGKERATLNAVLADGKYDFARFQRTFLVMASQRSYLDVFRKYGSPEVLAAFDAEAKSDAFLTAERMRDAVLAKGLSGGFDIAAEDWFRVITEKIDRMKKVEDLQAEHILKTAEALALQAKHALLLSVVLAAVVTGAALASGFLVMRSITGPLSRMLNVLQDIAEGEGDLTRRLQTGRRDEFGEVSLWFNRFVDNVHGIVSQAVGTTGRVSTAVASLNGTAEEIALTVEKVASQTTGMSTAGEEMSATSTDISGNCIKAAEASSRAGATAREGARVVQETLLGMQNIAHSVQESANTVASLGARSDQIGAIVDTIEDIADQTNLLALNAAIEAARAGEQGRGFAVVADEVRALAERTTRATREIGAMIKAIQEETAGAVASMENGIQEVAKGMESSRRSGDALADILEVINEVTAQVHQIATAAEEQTAVTSEMSASIHQISEVVCETSRGACETAQAATQLSRLADDLKMAVGRFKLA